LWVLIDEDFLDRGGVRLALLQQRFQLFGKVREPLR